MKMFLILLVTIPIFATNVKFEYNENVNLVRFLFTIADYGEGSILLKSIYEKNRGSKDKEAINKFIKIVDSVPRNVDIYPDAKKLPEDYRRWKKRSELLTYYGALSKNLNDFKLSLYSIYPTRKAYQLSKIIDYFLPIYRKIYFNNKSKQEINKIINYSKKVNIKTKSFLKMEKVFYNSQINLPEIKIFIFPLFINKKDGEFYKKNNLYITRSRSFKSLQVVESVLPFKSNMSFYGIVLHEIAHFCYDSSSFMKEFLKEMNKYEGKYGKFASKYLNEALATAIGNGYISNKMNMQEKGTWYNNLIIDKYAHKLYPVIEKMLDKNQNLKIEQAESFVKIFKESFPNILTRKEIVFNSINMISSNSFKYMTLINVLRKYVTINSSSASSPINHKFTIKSYHKKDKKTQIFVLRHNEIDDLKVYSEINLKQLKKDSKNKAPFVRITFNKKEDRFELFFLVNNLKNYKDLVHRIMKLEKMTQRIVYLYK